MESEEFQAWRNGFYGHFETPLYDSLVRKRKDLLVWRAPDMYFLTIQDSILMEYSFIDTRAELEARHGRKLGVFLGSEERALLGQSPKIVKSLVLKRLMEWHRISLWSCMAAYHCVYESVARELRFLVEDSVQSLYADQQRPNDTIDESILKNLIKNNSYIMRSMPI